MEFRKWNVLSFLNSPTDPYLSFGSTSLDIDSDLIFLCGLGLFLLFLWYLVGFPCLPTFCKIKSIQKHQGRTRRRPKGGTLKGCRFHQIETEEKTKLISILKSPLGRHDDTIHFRQLLCPDPFCEAHVSVSILPGEFALSDELRKKLEHHLRKRLIQHRWGLPRRIKESVSLMLPPDGFLEASKSESSDGVSLISVFKGQSSKHVSVELIQPGSFRERSLEMLQLEKDVGKDQEHSQENGQEDHLLKDSNSSSNKDLGYDSEKNINSQIVSLSEKNLRGSAESLQLENVLKVHLSKKFEEINEGRLPGTVHSSWHAIKQTLMLSAKSHTEMKERSLPSSVGECYSLNTFQDLTFVDPSAQQMLEAHIKRFRMRMLWGLPSKVLESIQIFKLKDASSQSLSHASFASSTNAISEPDSKFGNSKSFRSSKSFHGNKVGTTNSAPVLGHCLPATSLVGKEGQRVLRQSHSAVNHELAEDVQKIKDPRQICLPVSLCITGRGSHRQVQLADGYPRKPLAKQAGARFEPKYKSMSSSDKGKMQQGKKVKSEPVSMPKVSREIFKAEELECLQLKTNDMLTTNKSGSSQITNVNENKAETTVTTESPPPKLPVPQDPKRVSLKEQLLDELKFRLEKRKHSEAEGQPMDMSLASDNLTYKASPIPGQGISGGDTGESQVLHVHVEDRGIRMEQQEEPWVPKHGFQRCQDKNFPPTVKRVSSSECRAKELGGGDAGLGTSQLRRKSFPPQETVREEMLVSKSSQTLSKKGQSIPEGHIRKRMKHFLQWLYPGEKRKRREDPQEKGSPISSVQSRRLVKSRSAATGSTEAQKIVTDIRKFLEEKLGYQHALDLTSSQEDPLSPVHFGQSQKKAVVLVHTEPVPGHPFNFNASSKVTNPKSRHQEAIFAGELKFLNILEAGRHRSASGQNQEEKERGHTERLENLPERSRGGKDGALSSAKILTELKFKFKNKEHSQADHCPTDTSPTSSRLPSKSLQTPAQSVSTGDMAASQVPHIHSEDSGTSMEQRRNPSKHALLKCQDNNFPPAAEREPLGSKAGEYRSEDSGTGMSTGRKKSHLVEERELKDASSSLSQSEQLPPESFFRNKMRRFFQWIDFMRKIKDQESAQQKAKFMSTFAQHQDSTESAAFFVSHGPLEAHELMRAIGKILEEKLACRFESEALQLSQHKKELQTQVKPGKGHPSNYGALPDLRQEEWLLSMSNSFNVVSYFSASVKSVKSAAW
ncbi:hypothetical protein AB1E18_006663 [Capra hircus]